MSDGRMEFTDPTLCFPDSEKSCFACCPPIRPAGYEHIQHRNILRRILSENSEGFNKEAVGIVPITGFSCWALGYIDNNHKLIGCLLHSAQNGGVDFRFRIDYGKKCQREICPQAKVFSELGLDEKKFWLQLTSGLDSFSYSSKKLNPLFRMIDWGGDLLSRIASKEDYRAFTSESFFHKYPFFSAIKLPKAHAYLIKWLVKREGTNILQSKTFSSKFLPYSTRLSERVRQALTHNPPYPPLLKGGCRGDSSLLSKWGEWGDFGGLHTHLLDLDRDFLDFLRLSARIVKISREDAVVLEKMVDEQLDRFRQRLLRT